MKILFQSNKFLNLKKKNAKLKKKWKTKLFQL